NSPFEDAIENIDIGGPTMLRSAAKNYKFTAAVCDPSDYEKIINAVSEKGGIPEDLSLEFSRKVFNHTAAYDAVISGFLNSMSEDSFPENLTLTYKKIQSLRYGENPHQKAAFYRPAMEIAKDEALKISGAVQLQGKELSFNNMLDFSSALMSALSLPGNGVVIVKHLNPCGAAMTESGEKAMAEAFIRARECDPISAFGGVIALNGICDEKTAEYITENFVEGVIAREFTDGAKNIFTVKKNVRLIQIQDPDRFMKSAMEIRQVYDGILLQEADVFNSSPADWKVVTKRKPDEKEMKALHFAWRLVRHVKSNAIVFCSENRSLGVGAGQMSRVDSTEIAVMKANKNGMDLKGSVVGSDAFFPFRDGVDAVAAAGAKAIVQPGGSVRDEEVIQAADEHGIAMVFTGYRHFKH
ncbi:MAG: bifunctional phosphoribosylaminoimidazolecarboxamide formyltransferase/IMP cyclohydrolase, partial [Spirochaetia bacterium]|nr:bifunctional phosphoribosylaminoimidazolecarboxamide formyltransferase/IMP cyclohydrolase [Spirochaetia bacterium]